MQYQIEIESTYNKQNDSLQQFNNLEDLILLLIDWYLEEDIESLPEVSHLRIRFPKEDIPEVAAWLEKEKEKSTERRGRRSDVWKK